MPKTIEVVSATILGALRKVKELSDALPTPAGPAIKGILQTTLYILELAEVGNKALNISEKRILIVDHTRNTSKARRMSTAWPFELPKLPRSPSMAMNRET